MPHLQSFFAPLLLGILTGSVGARPHAVHFGPAKVKEKPPPPLLKDALPAGAIARLGTPQPQKNYLALLSVVFLSDGKTVATTGPIGKLAFWEAQSGKEIRSSLGHVTVVLSADGKMIASRSAVKEKNIRILDSETGKEIAKVTGTEADTFYRDYCFSPDGKHIAVGGGSHNGRDDDPPVRLYEVKSGKEIKQFPLREVLSTIVFSPDGRFLITLSEYGMQKPIQIWDVSTGKALRHFEGDQLFHATSMGISRDGKYLASVGTNPSICVWEIENGKELWRIQRLKEYPVAVDFSPNGRMMAVGLAQGGIVLFEAATGGERGRFSGHKEWAISVAFSPCGLMLASTGRGDFLPVVWDVTGQILGRGKKPRPFSAEEMNSCWHDLSGKDATVAWTSMRDFLDRPDQALPYFKRHLKPAPKFEPKIMGQLLKDLDSSELNIREKATKALAEIGNAAEPFLRKLLMDGPSATAKACVEDLLGGKEEPGRIWKAEMSASRAVEALEYLRTPEAVALLKLLARGAPAAARTQQSKIALDQLAKRVSLP